MFEMEMSISARKAKHSRKDVGIANPTNNAARMRKNHDHHKGDGGEHRALKLLHHAIDDAGLVVGRADLHSRPQPVRPLRSFFLDDVLDPCRGVDQVVALALDDLQSNGLLAVEPCRAGAILEGQIDLREIAECDDPVAVLLYGQVVDVARFVEGRWNLDREGALRGLDLASRDQLVVVLDRIDELSGRDVVGFEAQGVDQNFEHFVPPAGNARLEDRVHCFKLVLQVLGDAHHRAFRHGAGQVHDDDRELRKVDLLQRVLLGPHGKVGLRLAHGITHIRENLGLVPTELELQRDACVIFCRRGGHGFQAVKIGQLGLHRFDEQGFAVFRRDARERDRDEQRRNFDIRLAFLGQRGIGKGAHDEAEQDKGQHHPRAL